MISPTSLENQFELRVLLRALVNPGANEAHLLGSQRLGHWPHRSAFGWSTGGWSLANLVAEHGDAPIAEFRRAFPRLSSIPYRLEDRQAARSTREASDPPPVNWPQPAASVAPSTSSIA